MVDKKTICAQYAHALVEEHLAQFLKQALGILKSSDSESLHRARVSLRRLANLFSIFEDVLPRQNIKKWDKKITQAGKALGKSRDLDVHVNLLKSNFRKFPSGYRPEIKKIISSLERARRKEQLSVKRILKDLARHNIIKKARTAISRPIAYPVKDKSLLEMAEKKVVKRLKHFLSFSYCVHHPEDRKTLHRMRIAAKKLRYTLESFEKIYGPKTKYFYHTVYVLQIALGEFHDAETLIHRLQKEKNQEDKKDVEAVHYLCDFLAQVRLKAYERFLGLWKKSKKQKTWERLKGLLEKSIASTGKEYS